MYSLMRMGLGSMSMPQNHFQKLHLVNGKGKGKAIDFDAAFTAVEKERMEALTSKLEQSRIVEVQGETPEKPGALESDFQKSVRPVVHVCKQLIPGYAESYAQPGNITTTKRSVFCWVPL